MSTKEIWIVRHGKNRLDTDFKSLGTWQANCPLSQEGRDEIARVKRAYIDGETFKILACSWFTRAYETATILVPEPNRWRKTPALAPRLYIELDSWLKDHIKDMDPREYPNIDDIALTNRIFRPDFSAIEARWMLHAIIFFLNELGKGEKALLVSHRPLIDLLRGLLDLSFPPLEQRLEKGGMYKLIFKYGSLWQVIHCPPPK
ncbi:histidine phosphatase family protein [bacterium]|nr:histidine phosphatase family protein [bacterium]